MICKIYYTRNFNGGHTSSEVLYEFIGCECSERGLAFRYFQNDEIKTIFRSFSEIEDFKVMSVNPVIF